ncbi:MAG: transcription elongation factor GreA [Alphaproteobacteria bacterium]|jgi:transcription elongation factor GreA|nr:transcription elongation factor GreA [Alphaproteobacteria bacterium]
MEKKPISKQGFEALNAELKHLREVERPEIIKVIQWARSLGDLSENADYTGAKEKQRIIDSRIKFLENYIKDANVIDIDSLSGNRITFGASVVAEDSDGNLMQCKILSDVEADGKTIIACTSPVGRSFIGKCVGDICTVQTPSGEKEYEIIEVKFK